MFDPVNTPQAQLVSGAVKAVGSQSVLDQLLAALAGAGVPVSLLVLLPAAGKSLMMRAVGGPEPAGPLVLGEILFGNWQSLLGLPDSMAEAVALAAGTRGLIAEALLSVSASVVGQEAARLGALAGDEANHQLPVGWDTPAENQTTEGDAA